MDDAAARRGACGAGADRRERARSRSELNAWLKGMQKAREAAERKRLFYVACTRAREELHLFAAPETKKDGEISRRVRESAGGGVACGGEALCRAAPAPASVAKMFVMSLSPELRKMSSSATWLRVQTNQARPAMLQRLPLSFEPRGGLRWSAGCLVWRRGDCAGAL